MLLPALAIAVGLVAGVARRPRHRHLAAPRVRAWAILVAGVVAQLVSGLVAATAVVLLSYALLLAFAGRNLHLVGMPVVFVGLALNAAVIGANGGMPVRADALEAVGVIEPGEADDPAALDLGAKRHIEDGDDRLAFLGDIVPVRALERVVSFGDLILYVGLADVVANLVRRRRRRGSHEAPAGWTPADDHAVARLLASEQVRILERASS
jgi:hypothetical protein